MKMSYKKLSLLVLLSLFSSQLMLGQMRILSGPEKGSYYQFVQNMITVVEMDSIFSFTNVSTNGSAYNFDQITDPNSPVKMVMIQSDYLYYEQMLDDKNNTNKTGSLRVLMPLAFEEIQVVTRDDEKLTKLQDLAGLPVACGTEQMGTYATAILMKDRSRVFWNTRVLHYDDALKQLMGYQIDAFIIVGTAPMEMLDFNPQAMVTQLSIMNLDNVNDWAKYYTPETITAGTYKWLDSDVKTYGVQTVMIVNDAKLTAEDKVLIDKFKSSVESHYLTLVEIGHPKWAEVNFASWNPSNWPLYKN
jgi:TRAP transporter TAXI family solute receptor